eukprot:2891360-Rhodomonas_salina.2
MILRGLPQTPHLLDPEHPGIGHSTTPPLMTERVDGVRCPWGKFPGEAPRSSPRVSDVAELPISPVH